MAQQNLKTLTLTEGEIDLLLRILNIYPVSFPEQQKQSEVERVTLDRRTTHIVYNLRQQLEDLKDK